MLLIHINTHINWKKSCDKRHNSFCVHGVCQQVIPGALVVKKVYIHSIVKIIK